MKAATALGFIANIASALTTTVSYDPGYDECKRSMTVVACSNGDNGLITKYGWQTQADIPHFPNIGGSSHIPGWNSDQCGQCYSVTYNGKTIFFQAIDHVDEGLNMSEHAMNQLTGGQAEQLGRIEAEVKKIDVSNCSGHPLDWNSELCV